jgi:hypothetical protein
LAIGLFLSYPENDSLRVKPNQGLASVCNQYGAFAIHEKCVMGEPSVALWGDSYAMSWASGFKNHLPGTGFVQITRAGCPPMLGLAQMNRSYTPAWAYKCIDFQMSALRYIQSQNTIKTVVMTSPFGLSVKEDNLILTHDGRSTRLSIAEDSLGLTHLLLAIKSLTESGKRVIVLGPTPSDGVNRGRCFSRQRSNLPSLHQNSECLVDRRAAESRDALMRWKLQSSIQDNANVLYIPLYKYLCNDYTCRSIHEGQNLYVDDGHLSHYGTAYVWSQMKPEVDRFMEE